MVILTINESVASLRGSGINGNWKVERGEMTDRVVASLRGSGINGKINGNKPSDPLSLPASAHLDNRGYGCLGLLLRAGSRLLPVQRWGGGATPGTKTGTLPAAAEPRGQPARDPVAALAKRAHTPAAIAELLGLPPAHVLLAAAWQPDSGPLPVAD